MPPEGRKRKSQDLTAVVTAEQDIPEGELKKRQVDKRANQLRDWRAQCTIRVWGALFVNYLEQ